MTRNAERGNDHSTSTGTLHMTTNLEELKFNITPEPAYEIVRTHRKNSSLIEVTAGRVKLTIPKTLSTEEINEMLQIRQVWIQQRLQEYTAIPSMTPREYVSGELFLYLGYHYCLKLGKTDSMTIDVQQQVSQQPGQIIVKINDFLPDTHRHLFVKWALENWYFLQAVPILREKTLRYANMLGVMPRTMEVKTYKARWGGCSINKDIYYNWKIIMAPEHIVNYLVAHEVSHLLHHNHSAGFWKDVERIIPDRKDCQDWLKRYGAGLTI